MENKIINFGCRLNSFESEIIKTELGEAGIEGAIVFNSCAVTKEAERQLRQSIRKYHQEFPDRKIIVTGCAAQLNPEFYHQMKGVDLVLGNQEKLDRKNYLLSEISPQIIVTDIMELKEAASHLASSFSGKARAFLEIQNGCNHRCTFCIIPFARGNNRSIPSHKIIKNIQLLLDSGYQEIVLTGVDITDYGSDLPDVPNLASLSKEILRSCPDLKRLRFSSLDVAEIGEDFRELIASDSRIMPHFHLSLQSGDDMILKRMKRRHNRSQIIDFCEFIRKYRPQTAIGADIITGFPTESEEMFLNSLNLVKETEIPMLHIFPYSEREGTPAAKIPKEKQIPIEVRKTRAKILISEGKKQLQKYMNSFIGQKIIALAEDRNVMRSDHFLKIETDYFPDPGSVAELLVTDVKDEKLIASKVGV